MNTWTNENVELITSLFDLQNEDEIESVVDKLNQVEVVWTSENFSMLDLINSWNEKSNNRTVTMIQLLDAYYKSSISITPQSTTYDIFNNLITEIATNTREQGVQIGNTLKTVASRIDTDHTKKELSQYGIKVEDTDTFAEVLNKVKVKINEISDSCKKSELTFKLSEILGGKYNLSKVSTILT